MMLRTYRSKKRRARLAEWRLWLFVLIGCALLQGTAAGQEQRWKLEPAGPSTVEAEEYEKELRQRNAEQLRWITLIFSGILLLFGLLLYKRSSRTEYFSRAEMLQLTEQRRRLLRALAHLDEQYAQGTLSDASYHAERQRQKQRIAELTQLCNSPLSTSGT